MSAMLLRVLIITAIGLLIMFGIRRIWRDWSGQFRRMDEEDRARIRARDKADRQAGGIIELEKDKDGTYRPGGDDSRKD